MHFSVEERIFSNSSFFEDSERSIITNIQLNEGFFVPAHPLWMVLVPYGLYLTFASYLCPTTCLPSFLPLAPLATFLGTSFPLLMGTVSAISVSLHIGEASGKKSLQPQLGDCQIVDIQRFLFRYFWLLASRLPRPLLLSS